MYGTLSETTYVDAVDGGESAEYPRFQLLLFEVVK